MSINTPIDFPPNVSSPGQPSNGDLYTFEGRVYQYTSESGLPGYWKINTPGENGPASVEEINAPLIDSLNPQPGFEPEAYKYITPATLDESKYTAAGLFQLENEPEFAHLKGVPFQFTRKSNSAPNFNQSNEDENNGSDAANNGLYITQQLGGYWEYDENGQNRQWISSGNSAWDFNMKRGSIGPASQPNQSIQGDYGQVGTVSLMDSFVSGNITRAATPNAVRAAAEMGKQSAYYDYRYSGQGYMRIKDRYNNNNGMMLMWGTHTFSQSAKSGTVNFSASGKTFSANAYYVGISPRKTNTASPPSFAPSAVGSGNFNWTNSGSTGPSLFWWFAIGPVTGLSSGSDPIYTPWASENSNTQN